VVDFAPADPAAGKLKKARGPLTLRLEQTPDILAELGPCKQGRVLVGFAAETEDLVRRAREKLTRKQLDLVVANEVEVGFGGDTNRATLVFGDGRAEPLPQMHKRALADRIMEEVAKLLRARTRGTH